MERISNNDVQALLGVINESEEIVPLSREQLAALKGGVSRAEYCATALKILTNFDNDLEGNTGLPTVWRICKSEWQ